MVAQSIALNIATEYLQAVRAAGVEVRKAYLFGSHAANRQHEWSDIDVALVADDFTGLATIDKDRFRRLHIQPKFMAIEVHTFPTKRWKDGDPLIKEILRTGIELSPALASANA